MNKFEWLKIDTTSDYSNCFVRFGVEGVSETYEETISIENVANVNLKMCDVLDGLQAILFYHFFQFYSQIGHQLYVKRVSCY